MNRFYRHLNLDEHPAFRGYFHVAAHSKAGGRRLRGGKVARDAALATYIEARLSDYWSPEQIAGYLRTHPDSGLSVCHETIYQFIYGAQGRARQLGRLLPSRRKNRRRRYARRPRGLFIPLQNTIGHRPFEIGERTRFGDWEGDLMIFRREYGTSNVTSLIERRSRYMLLSCNRSRHSAGVMAGIERQLGPLPAMLRRSMTFDRGTEFASYPVLASSLGIASYFCQPSAPWQKGSVENGNGRLRRFLPLDTDIAMIDEKELDRIAARLNSIPRKCLGYRTPRDVFDEQIRHARAE
ncbi:IS30 family transposase [Sphingobium fluviale]|uniref:IS30 family transposase n=1 Tax=Sphingobium fluviale TaxID=2506423 RepID=A0A4Q1KCQ7_9SPHN|nr:IS30 family transposase [Sphingobium fluviale]RXR24717.1 IS30 family transposase [Sphingobium fluviale]